MTDSRSTALIAIDWGTTSARAYRLDARGRRRSATRSAPLGIQRIARRRFRRSARHAARRLARRRGAADRLRHDRQPAGLDRSAVRRNVPADLDALGARADARRPAASSRSSRARAASTRPAFPTSCAARKRRSSARSRDDDGRCSRCFPGTHSKWAIVERGTHRPIRDVHDGRAVRGAARAQHPRPDGRRRGGRAIGGGVRARRRARPRRRRPRARDLRRAHAGACRRARAGRTSATGCRAC